jgi:ABC-type multidrug transport system fused ATPase/permease subunit
MSEVSSEWIWVRTNLYPYARKYQWALFAGLLLSCILAGLNYYNLQLIRTLFDEKAYLESFRHFLPLVAAIFGIFSLNYAVNWAQAGLNSGMIIQINRDLIADLYDRICGRPYLFFHSHSPGQLLTVLLGDLTQVTPLITLICVDAVRNVLVLTILLAYLVSMQWQIMVLYACLGLSYLLVTNYFSRRVKELIPAVQSTREAIHNKLIEFFQVINLLKIYDVAGKEQRKVTELNALLADQNKRIILLENTRSFLLDLVVLSVICAFVLAGHTLISRGVITAGKFVAILVASHLVNGYVRSLFDIYARVQQARAYVTRLDSTIGGPWDKNGGEGDQPAGGGIPVAGPVHAIVFDKVRFTYHHDAVLENVSCTFASNVMTGITGESGHGKTTLLNLILRLVNPTDGVITVNGVSLKEIDAPSYMRQVSYLPQSALLFNGTIAENIAFGDALPDRDRIVRSAAMASIHAVIAALPQGYDTVITTGMSSFSEGEKKRIEIARALYKDSAVIVFDEPTANLDLKNKVALMEALKLLRNKVVIVVSHDLSVLEQCDRVLLINARKEIEVMASYAEVYQYYANSANTISS